MRNSIFSSIFIAHILLGFPAFSGFPNDLDLEGDKKLTKVNLPYKYYHNNRDDADRKFNDELTLIHQGGYKIYDINEDKAALAVLGPLNPCIGVAITDGKKVVVFHKHWSNSLASMGKIIQENLNLSDKEQFYARIYTTKDDILWEEKGFSYMHDKKSHRDEVLRVKDFLNHQIGINRRHILAELWSIREENGDLRYSPGFLGRYELSETCVAIRMNDLFEETSAGKTLRFYSIDPFEEDVFGYRGTYMTYEEYLGPRVSEFQREYPEINLSDKAVSFDDLSSKDPHQGYKIQRGLCERRLNKEETEFYLKHFGKSKEELFAYDTLDFIPLNENNE